MGVASLKPEDRTAAFACSIPMPNTLGTETSPRCGSVSLGGTACGPCDRSRLTCDPGSTRTPGAGFCPVTVPAAWSDATVRTWPTIRLVERRLNSASCCGRPISDGTETRSGQFCATWTLTTVPGATRAPAGGSCDVTHENSSLGFVPPSIWRPAWVSASPAAPTCIPYRSGTVARCGASWRNGAAFGATRAGTRLPGAVSCAPAEDASRQRASPAQTASEPRPVGPDAENPERRGMKPRYGGGDGYERTTLSARARLPYNGIPNASVGTVVPFFFMVFSSAPAL